MYTFSQHCIDQGSKGRGGGVLRLPVRSIATGRSNSSWVLRSGDWGWGGGGALVREGNEESLHCFLSLGLQLRELVCLVQYIWASHVCLFLPLPRLLLFLFLGTSTVSSASFFHSVAHVSFYFLFFPSFLLSNSLPLTCSSFSPPFTSSPTSVFCSSS